MPTFPFWVITNLFKPLELAVNKSPTVLSTMRAAFEVVPATLAVKSVPVPFKANFNVPPCEAVKIA